MTVSPVLGLTLMAANMAQKEVVFNEAIIAFDALFKGSVISATVTVPPSSPGLGDAYIVGASASGAWSGKDYQIAFYYNGWQFVVPPLQLTLYDVATSVFMRYAGTLTHWVVVPVSPVTLLNDLGDVTGTPADGQVLTWNAGAGQWEPAAPAFVATLHTLTDVSVVEGSPIDGHYLTWNNTLGKWVATALPTTLPNMLALPDVSVAGALSGYVCVYNTTGPSVHFVAPSTLGVVAQLSDVGDVSYSGLVVGSYLQWNGAVWGPSASVATYTFAGMSDGPGSMVGHANEFLVVNSVETALAYVSLATLLSTVTIDLQHLNDVPSSIGTPGQVLAVNSGATGFVYVTPANAIEIDNNGTLVDGAAVKLNFIGATLSTTAHDVTITIPTPIPALLFEDHGSGITTPTTLNFAGSGVTIAESGGVLTATINAVTSLSALSDVNTSAPATGDLLQFDGYTGKWKNNSLVTMLGAITGTAQPATYELGPFAPPTAVMFPTAFQATGLNINQIANRGLAVQPSTYGSGTYAVVRHRTLAANTAPWEITTRVAPNSLESAGHAAGICVLRSANTSMFYLAIGDDTVSGNPWTVRFGYFGSGGGSETILNTIEGEYHWLQLSFDGVYVRARVSNDGIMWMALGTTQNAGSILGGAPDEVGLFQRLANATAGDAGGLYTYYDDPDYPASGRTVQGFVNLALSSLTDVSVAEGPGIDGYALAWNNSAGKWEPLHITGGGGGVTAFTGLSDVPGSYSGASGKFVKVNSGGTGLEFDAVTIDTALSALSDVSVTEGSGIDGYTLNWSNGAGKWVAVAPVTGGGSGGGNSFTPPLASALTAVTNLNGATLTQVTTDKVPSLNVAPGSTDADAVLYTALAAAPSGAFSLVTKVKGTYNGTASGWNGAGVVLHNSGNGDNLFAFINLAGALFVTSFSGGFTGGGVVHGGDALLDSDFFIHIDFDGTNTLSFGVSRTGDNPHWAATQTLSGFLTAITHVGIGWSGGTLISWDFLHYFAGTLHSAGITAGGGSSTLASDTDVLLTSPADNDVLTYEASSSKWKNKPPTGGTSVVSVPTSTNWRVRFPDSARAAFTGTVFGVGVSELKWLASDLVTQLATGGTATASSSVSGSGGYNPSELYDGSTASNDGWYSSNDVAGGFNSWCGYTFASAVLPAAISLAPLHGYPDSFPISIVVEFLDSDSVWQPIATFYSAVATDNTFQTFTLPTTYIKLPLGLGPNVWAGDSLAVIGDSITAMSPGGINWATVLRDAIGAAAGPTDGVSGSTMSSVATRIAAMDLTYVGTLLIFIGTNDYGNSGGRVLGAIGDIGSSGTFYGDVYGAINAAFTAKPSIKLAFATPIQRTDQTAANSQGHVLQDYVDAIVNSCGVYSVPVYDAYRKAGFNAFNYATYSSDGLHPGAAGHIRFARAFAGFLLGLCGISGGDLGGAGGGSSTLASDTDVAITSSTEKQMLVYETGTSKWTNINTPYNLGLSIGGLMTASEILLQHVVPYGVTFPAGLTGSYAKANTAATASTTVTINKNGSAVGSMTWAASGTIATFTFASATSFAAGDILQLVAPSSADVTLADIGVTLAGYRS